MKAKHLILVFSALLLGATAFRSRAQQRTLGPETAGIREKIGVLKVKGNVYLIHGAGPNITMQAGDQIVVLVDPGPEEMSEQVRAAIRSVSNKPIGLVFNTSAQPDHAGANGNLSKGGYYMMATAGTLQMNPQATIVAHLNVLNRFSAKDSGVPASSWPTDTFDTPDWKFYANGEPIIIEHAPNAHSDGDSIVFFRSSDVVSTGDIFDMRRYPVIDAERGGTLQGILDALNHISQDIAVPENNEQGGTMIIPGHGRVCDRNDIANYRDMLTIIRDRIQDQVKKGKTLDEVKAARLTYDYDGGYGVETGPWTTTKFVETVYRELSRKK